MTTSTKPVETGEPDQTVPAIPQFNESMGGALIDSARISVMAALGLLPEWPRKIVLPGDDPDSRPSLHECLDQAMQWLDAARVQTIEQSGRPPTSLHFVRPQLGIRCSRCGCTEERACETGCTWASTDPPICSRCV